MSKLKYVVGLTVFVSGLITLLLFPNATLTVPLAPVVALFTTVLWVVGLIVYATRESNKK